MRAIETFPNLVTMFFTRTAEQGDKPFLWRKSEGIWHPLSWNEVAAQVAGEECARRAMDAGMRSCVVLVNGPGAGRESAVRAIASTGMKVTLIKDVTPIPHNGCRPPKRRRV